MNATEGGNSTVLETLLAVNSVNITGRFISIVTVFTSLVIFLTIKNLRDKNNVRIHINLFASHLLMDISFIIIEAEVLFVCYKKMALPKNVHVFMEIINSYFELCNTFWMTCEAIYLLYLIYTVWLIEDRILFIIYFIGWGIPSIYMGFITFFEFTTQQRICCTNETLTNYLTSIKEIPIDCCIIVNVLILLTIISYLVIGTRHFEKPFIMGARAALILTPLFGVQHFFFSFIPVDPVGVGLFLNGILSSTQGILLSILYCFKMKEVKMELRLAWKRNYYLFRNGSNITSSSRHSSTFRPRKTSFKSSTVKSVQPF